MIGDDVDPALVPDLESPHARAAVELVERSTIEDGSFRLEWREGSANISLSMPGQHQVANAQLAVALALETVAAGWLPELDPLRVERALDGARWPGRLSVHRVEGREVLVDCAHNLEAAQALAHFLARSDRRYNLVFSCLEDKPVEEMAVILRPRVERVVVCPLADERAMDLGRMLAAFPGAASAASPLEALRVVPDPVLAAGSVRLAGALLAYAGEGEVQ